MDNTGIKIETIGTVGALIIGIGTLVIAYLDFRQDKSVSVQNVITPQVNLQQQEAKTITPTKDTIFITTALKDEGNVIPSSQTDNPIKSNSLSNSPVRVDTVIIYSDKTPTITNTGNTALKTYGSQTDNTEKAKAKPNFRTIRSVPSTRKPYGQ